MSVVVWMDYDKEDATNEIENQLDAKTDRHDQL